MTLLGQNVNSYNDLGGGKRVLQPSKEAQTRGFVNISRRPTHGVAFTDLMQRVAAVDPEMRVRFTSPHPKDFPDSLLALIRDTPNLCKSVRPNPNPKPVSTDACFDGDVTWRGGVWCGAVRWVCRFTSPLRAAAPVCSNACAAVTRASPISSSYSLRLTAAASAQRLAHCVTVSLLTACVGPGPGWGWGWGWLQVALMRETIPNVALSTDIITGFCGEARVLPPVPCARLWRLWAE